MSPDSECVQQPMQADEAESEPRGTPDTDVVVAVETQERSEDDDQPARKLKRVQEEVAELGEVPTIPWTPVTVGNAHVETNGDVYRCARCHIFCGKTTKAVMGHQLHCRTRVKQEQGTTNRIVHGVAVSDMQWMALVDWVNNRNMPKYNLSNLLPSSATDEAEIMMEVMDTDVHVFFSEQTQRKQCQ